MPIKPITFTAPTFEQANPMLSGMKAGIGIGSDISGLISKNLEQQKSRQELQWNPKIWQSEIGLRDAQAGLASQQAQWVGPQAQAEIFKNKAQGGLFGVEAQKQALLVNMIKEKLAGTQPTGTYSTASAGASESGKGQAAAAEETQNPNVLYGVEIPQPSKEDIVNKMAFGIDSFSKKYDTANEKSKQEFTTFNKNIADAVASAKQATDMNKILSLYNNAMDKSKFKGPLWGHTPIMPGMDNEQIADKAASQLTPNAAAQLRDAMGSARFSNLDMQYAQNLKVDRTLGDDARKTQSTWLTLVNERTKNIAKMQTMLMNSKQVTSSQADMLTAEMQNQLPLISETDKNGAQYALPENVNKWPAYTTPKAIAAIKTSGTYHPSKAALAAVYMQKPSGEIVPVKSSKVGKALKLGYRTI